MASARGLIAIVTLVLGLALYALIMARLAGLVLPPDQWLAHLAYYGVFGVLWVWPAVRVVRWSARGGGGRRAPRGPGDGR